MSCTFGVAPSALTVTPEKMVTSSGQPAGTIMDFKPMLNIKPFGMCNTLTNPQVATATTAASGVLTPQPCIPVTTSPWVPGAVKVKIKNMPALTSNCKLMCMWTGVISFSNPGQVKVSVK